MRATLCQYWRPDSVKVEVPVWPGRCTEESETLEADTLELEFPRAPALPCSESAAGPLSVSGDAAPPWDRGVNSPVRRAAAMPVAVRSFPLFTAVCLRSGKVRF